jgi:hypothetical protein
MTKIKNKEITIREWIDNSRPIIFDRITGFNEVLRVTASLGPMSKEQMNAFCDTTVSLYGDMLNSANGTITTSDAIKILLPSLRILKQQHFDNGLQLPLGLQKIIEYGESLGLDVSGKEIK